MCAEQERTLDTMQFKYGDWKYDLECIVEGMSPEISKLYLQTVRRGVTPDMGYKRRLNIKFTEYCGHDSVVKIPKIESQEDEIHLAKDIFKKNGGCVKEIVLSNSVRVIEKETFECCPMLESIMVESDNPVFSEWKGILFDKGKCRMIFCPMSCEEVWIPKETKVIELHAFDNRKNLKAIHVEEGNQTFSDLNGVLYSKDKKVLLRCPEGKKGKIVVSDDTTEIGRGAFYNCKKIDDLEMPYNIESMECSSFDGCENFEDEIRKKYGNLMYEPYIFGGKILKNIEDDSYFYRDYIGERKILLLSSAVSDFGFGSCRNVEYIICDASVKFGWFTFMNCDNLKGIILLGEKTRMAQEEFSFTNSDYELKDIAVLKVIGVGGPAHCYGDYSGGSFSRANKIPYEMMWKICENDDVDLLETFIHTFFDKDYEVELDNEITNALEKNEFEKLEVLEKMGVNFSDGCPFDICLSDYEDNQKAYEFLSKRGMYRRRRRWDEDYF